MFFFFSPLVLLGGVPLPIPAEGNGVHQTQPQVTMMMGMMVLYFFFFFFSSYPPADGEK